MDQSPLPHGLLRYGVAPDHPEMRSASHEFDKLLSNQPPSTVRFFGKVKVASSLPETALAAPSEVSLVTLPHLKKSFDAILLAVGAQGRHARKQLPEVAVHKVLLARSYQTAIEFHSFFVSQLVCSRLALPGSHLRGIMAAGDIAKWYNGYTTVKTNNRNHVIQPLSERRALLDRLHFLNNNGQSLHPRVENTSSPHLTIIG